jgi:hypothetical protein
MSFRGAQVFSQRALRIGRQSHIIRRINRLERAHRSLLVRSSALHTVNTIRYIIGPITPPLDLQAFPDDDDDGT